MSTNQNVSRRQFLATASGAAAAATIVPRSVLGGTGRVAPSDKINAALGWVWYAGTSPAHERLATTGGSSCSLRL